MIFLKFHAILVIWYIWYILECKKYGNKIKKNINKNDRGKVDPIKERRKEYRNKKREQR